MIQQLYGREDLPMKDLQKIGLAENGGLNIGQDDLIALLSGRRTGMLRLENLFSDGVHIAQLDAKLSVKPNPVGELDLLVHPIYKQAQKPSYLTDTEAEKLETGEALNVEKSIFDDEGNFKDVLIEFDKDTNEFLVIDEARILAPDRINGQYLSLDQKERYRRGKEVELEDGTKVQFSATDKKGIRSNKLMLIASIMMDGGLSFILYKGLNHLFKDKQHHKDADVNSKGYYNDLNEMEEQERKGQSNDHKSDRQEQRTYTRSGVRR